jgi:hypothetical protein
MLRADLLRISNNCKLYNPADSEYYRAAMEFEHLIFEVFDGENTGALVSSSSTSGVIPSQNSSNNLNT